MKKAKDILTLVWKLLDGKKAYIGGAIIFVGGGLRALDEIDESTFKVIEALGLAVATIGLRHALAKNSQ